MVVLAVSVSINPVFSTIKLLRWFIICQEVAVMPDIGTVLAIQIAQASEKTSNRKYLLTVAQTVRYLARPGWPLKEDGNEIDSSFAQLLLLCGNHDSKIEQLQQHKISMHMIHLRDETIWVNAILRIVFERYIAILQYFIAFWLRHFIWEYGFWPRESFTLWNLVDDHRNPWWNLKYVSTDLGYFCIYP